MPKTLFSNLMHDGKLQIMMFTLSRKIEQHITNYLFKTQARNRRVEFLKYICLGLEKKVVMSFEVKPKAKALIHNKVEAV